MKKDNVVQFEGDTRNQNKRKRKKFFNVKTFGIILILIISVGGILFSPLFSIKNINITEMEKYTESEMCEKLNLNKGENIFSFVLSNHKKTLKNDQYIEDIDIRMVLPDTIEIKVSERKVRGYVPFMGSYLYIDEYGRVLDVQDSYKTNLPIVEGLEFDSFKIGDTLDVDNEESFEVIVTIAQLITKYNILEDIVRIDVKDPKNIKASMKNVEVLLGDLKDCDEKIRTMVAVMEQINDNDRGTLDLSDLSQPIVFKYLT